MPGEVEYSGGVLKMLIQLGNLLQKLQPMKTILAFLLLACYSQSATLATLNFSQILSTGIFIQKSQIGLTYDFADLINYFKNPLFLGYLGNAAVYNNSDYNFWQHIHVPIGYKYGCNSTLFGGLSINCTLDISANSTLLSSLNYFFSEVNQWAGSCNLGWDMERANFSRASYRSNFANYYLGFWGNYINIELIDRGDKLTNYTVTSLLSDSSKIASATYYSVQIYAPGLTEDSSSDTWWNNIPSFDSYNGVFSLRCVIFKKAADVTISNLMNDSYVDTYITKRLTQPNGNYNNPYNYPIALTDIRLTNVSAAGVDGVTNSFAAALWALDFSLKYMSIGGYFASFYTSFSNNNQSVLGPSPYFGPQGLYYGLLFANYAISKYAQFITPNVTAVGSQFIKVYAFDVWGFYRVVLINKDLNSSSNGTVDIALNSNGLLECTYMQASSLNATSGITIGNVSFVSNSSDFVGLYATQRFEPDENAVYHIPLSYAQAAICNQIPKAGFNQFPRRTSLTNFQKIQFVAVFLLLLLLV